MDRQLGKYRIIEEIGRGGFAAVYRAVDTELDRQVALKVLAPHLLWDPTFIERFRREAKAMAGLNHPHIATLYDYGEQEGSYFLVMEYVPGETLRQLVEREGPLPLQQVTSILKQVAAGLDYAHRQGVIHRDVKSSNVLLTPEGTAKLTDFGLVKVVAETSTLSSLGQSAGTPEYMAPEQFEGQEVGVYTDLYSLGVVLYEMCTGALPFTGPTPLAVMRGVVDKPPPDPSEVNPSLPPAVATVLLRALEKKPQNRYGSAGQLAVALSEAVEGEKEKAHRQQLAGLQRQAEAALAAADWDRLTALCGEMEALALGDPGVASWLVRTEHARAEAEAKAAREFQLVDLREQAVSRGKAGERSVQQRTAVAHRLGEGATQAQQPEQSAKPSPRLGQARRGRRRLLMAVLLSLLLLCMAMTYGGVVIYRHWLSLPSVEQERATVISGADLGQPVMARGIGEGNRPIGITDTFSDSEDIIYCVIPASRIDAGTSFFARWYYEGEPFEDTPTITADRDYTDTYIEFHIELKDFGVLSAGAYVCKIYVDGSPVQTAEFTVK